MAIRTIVTQEQEILRKNCRPVEKFDQKLWTLLDDMKDTLYKAQGFGLAAPQVGIMRRIAVIDVGEGYIELINPEIVDPSGEQRDVEGCLSCPDVWGYVKRPYSCTIKAQDRFGNSYEKRVEGVFCRCACHETDHLNGKLFIDLVDEFVKPDPDAEE